MVLIYLRCRWRSRCDSETDQVSPRLIRSDENTSNPLSVLHLRAFYAARLPRGPHVAIGPMEAYLVAYTGAFMSGLLV
jgi:hypothetical protein